MNAIFAIAQKDLRLLFRDRGNMFFTFGFPVLLAIFFGFVFGGDGATSKMDLALVNESSSELAAGIAKDLRADSSFEVIVMPTRESAIDLVRAGKVTAAVVLPVTLEDGIEGLFNGSGIPIEAIVDPARRAEAGLIQGKLNELAFRQLPKLFGNISQSAKLFASARKSLSEAKDLDPTQRLAANALIFASEQFMRSLPSESSAREPDAPAKAWSPVNVSINELPARKGAPRSSFDVSIPQGIVWGLAGCISAFAAGVVSERARGTLDRLRLAPITRTDLLAGKGLACFIAALLVQGLLVALAVVAFGSNVAQPFMVAVACIASAFAFSGLAMLVAGIARTEAEANGAGRGAILILAMIGGGTIPLFFMPPFMRSLSNASPFRWTVTAIEGPFWRDTPLSEQWFPLMVLFVIGIVGFFIGSRAVGRPFSR